jgi:ribosomal protein S3
MKLIEKLRSFFKDKKKEKLLKQVKWAIRSFYCGNGQFDAIVPLRVADLEITDIRIVQYNSKMIKIQIILGRPGLLIGKRGESFDKLVKYLSTGFDCKIEINLKKYPINNLKELLTVRISKF